MPAKPKTPIIPEDGRLGLLQEIPCIYLNDRTEWRDFKSALTDCGLVWNLPSWMTTIVYQGSEWKAICSGGTDLSTFFPAPARGPPKEGGEAKETPNLVTLLGLPKSMVETPSSSTLFCDLEKIEFESDKRLPARQKFWQWMIRCLRGTKPIPGAFHYLIDEVQPYDIAGLFKRLCQVLDQVTICSLDDELEAVIKLDFKPNNQNIFSYFSDLRRAVKRLHDLNTTLPETARITLPDAYLRSRLVRAARQVPVFKPVIDSLMIMPLKQWSAIQTEDLYHQLEAVCANDVSTDSSRNPRYTTTDDSVSANVFTASNQKKTKEKKPCFKFSRGTCNFGNQCSFSHAAVPEQKKCEKSASVPASPNMPKKKCAKCGNEHKPPCTWTGKCGWCQRPTHSESVCHDKKIGKARVNLAMVGDGDEICANTMLVEDSDLQKAKTEIEISVLTASTRDGICEKFIADSGANQHLHPNFRSASSFYRVGLKIGTATGPNQMVSDGVGSMIMYAPNGKPMPGFGKVVFAKQCSEKLVSIGNLCDAGMVCVFDNECLRTYQKSEVTVNGIPFTTDERDKKNKLYPISLYRNQGEKNCEPLMAALSVLNTTTTTPVISSNPLEDQPPILPTYIKENDGSLPTTLLARSYIKEGLSSIERYHAKFGDVGINHLKKALPNLKFPSTFRCEFCIDGKIHKFGHKACPPGTRTEYLPGVCIHSDHSGPYARSIGGARYSQLYLDRGSGFLWGARMAKKTGHYTETKKIFLDAAALSGRKCQIFHSDGEGVFTSTETKEILAEEKIRHEFSAPYDSNTNSFIERARRTIFEGVCTALLRSGAPASFWGEAELHKIFTVNVLPTVEDPLEKGKFISRKNLLEGNRRPYNLDHLMAFGTAATVYMPLERRTGGKHPAQRRSFKGAILGYAENMPAYRVWDFEAQKIRSVSFNFTICHEGFYPFRDRKNWPPISIEDPECFSPVIEGVLSTSQWKKFAFDEEDASEILGFSPRLVDDSEKILPRPVPEPVDASPPVEPTPVVSADFIPSVSPHLEEKKVEPQISNLKKFWTAALQQEIPAPAPEILPRRSERLALKTNFSQAEPEEKMDRDDPFGKPVGIPPPRTLREAKMSPWWPQYHDACQAEIDGHKKSGTWDLVDFSTIPKVKNILRGKWVLDDKRGEDGRVLKFKARYVAMGNTQKYLVDYDETFAGVMVAKSFRIMLSILNEDSTYEMEHWDVRMAFTQAVLDEEIFMYQPEGFEVDGANKICRLLKSLYGLKQSARNWQQMLISMLQEAGFVSLMADPCIFFLKKGDAWCMVSTHVDDIFCLFNLGGKILRDGLFKIISGYVDMENLGPVSWALKTTILRDRQAGIIKISQEQFTREYLKKKFLDSDEKNMPRDVISTPNFLKKFSQDDSFTRVDEKLKKNFQSDIGTFWWLAQISRPDIYFSVHTCAKLIQKPTKNLGLRIQQIIDYLAQTPSQGIIFQRNSNAPTLSGFVDAAFAIDADAISRIGYFFLFRGNLVSWCSENPKRIMTSSTEVECRGLVQIAKENQWHRQFHQELNLFSVESPTIVYEDNTASITMSKLGGIPHKRSKHFGIEWAYFKQMVDLKEIEPIYVSTNEQPADMLTKALPPQKFLYFRDMVMGLQKYQDHFQQVNSTALFIVGQEEGLPTLSARLPLH